MRRSTDVDGAAAPADRLGVPLLGLRRHPRPPRHAYRTQELCRVPQAQGKMPKAHGKYFAVRCTRQRVHDTVADGEDHLCRVLAAGHTTKPNAVYLFGTRHTKAT